MAFSSSSPLSIVNTLKAANVWSWPSQAQKNSRPGQLSLASLGWTVLARSAQLALVAPGHQSFSPKWRNYSFKHRLPFYVKYIFFESDVKVQSYISFDIYRFFNKFGNISQVKLSFIHVKVSRSWWILTYYWWTEFFL